MLIERCPRRCSVGVRAGLHSWPEWSGVYRYPPEMGRGRDVGVAGALNVWRGLVASGAVRVSDASDDTSVWHMAGLRVPMPGHASVTFDRSWWEAESNNSVSSLTLQVPYKRLQLMQRIQRRRTAASPS